MTATELRQKRGRLVDEARAIYEKAKGEKRELTADEKASIDSKITEARNLEAEITRLESLEGLENSVRSGERRSDPLPHETTTRHTYSLCKAIRQAGALNGAERLDGLELECSQELALRRGRQPRGFFMPLNVQLSPEHRAREARNAFRRHGIEARAFDTTAGTGGIPTILADQYIDLLRNRMVVEAAGATVMADMQGLFAIPRQSSAATLYWVAESGSVTTSAQAVDQVAFTPRTAGAMTDISRRLVEQISVDAEMFVRNDLANVVARGVDLAALNGTGASNQPTGILHLGSLPTVALGTNGGLPTFTGVVGLENLLSVANADLGSLGYVTNAKGRSILKTTAKIGSTFPIFLWEGGIVGELNGYPGYVTNQLPSNLVKGTSGAVCSPVIFANWADLVIAMWSGQDVIVDPYTGSASGTLRVVILQDIDINVRHIESFAAIVDMLTTGF